MSEHEGGDDELAEPLRPCIGIIYSLRVDFPASVFHGIEYIGQTTSRDRRTTAERMLRRRFQQHCRDSRTHPKEYGIRAMIGELGHNAIVPTVLLVANDTSVECIATWANQMEIENIASRGGVLRDMENRCRQTLNLTTGGAGVDTRWAYLTLMSDHHWSLKMKALTKFKELHGHTNPKRDVVIDGINLGFAVANIRMQRGALERMPSRMADLVRLNFVWSIYDAAFSEFLRELAEYKAKFGRDPPQSTPLGKKLHNRRMLHAKESLPLDQVVAMEELGVDWRPVQLVVARRAEDFDAIVEELRAFKRKHRTMKVPRGYVSPTGTKLGVVAKGIRQNQNHVKGRPDRIATLNSIGFLWKQ